MIEVKSIIGPLEKTNRELHSSLIAEGEHSGSMSSHVTDAEYSATNTALLAEMDLSTSDDDNSEVSVRGTTHENSKAVEFSRDEEQSPEVSEDLKSPKNTYWSEPLTRNCLARQNKITCSICKKRMLRKSYKKHFRTQHKSTVKCANESHVHAGKLKACYICGKLLTSNHMRRHERNVHNVNITNPPTQPSNNNLATSLVLFKEWRVDVENINLNSMRITPDDPCSGRRKMTLRKEAFGTYSIHRPLRMKQNQTCSICGKKTGDRYDLIRHCSSKHFKDHLMQYVNKGSLVCPLCGIDHKYISTLLGHIGGKHKREELEKIIRGDPVLDQESHNKVTTQKLPDKNDAKVKGEVENGENGNSVSVIKDERIPSPADHTTVPVETVAFPEPGPPILYPDEECQMSQIQEKTDKKGDVHGKVTGSDLRRILDSDSESE